MGYEHFCSVGDLLDFIEKHKLPRDAKVLMQRVEDKYFEPSKVYPESNAWKTVKKEGQFFNEAVRMNARIDSGEFNDKENYPDLTPELIADLRLSDVEMEGLKENYYHCWCPVKYPDDSNLYLDAHY